MAQSGFSKTGLGGILSYFTRHRTIANLLMVVMISMGFLAATQIRSQFFPDVVIDNVNVSVRWKGAGAEDVDNGIVALMEPALLAVEGVESARSTASEGRASIRLEFEADWDMARAAEDVKTAVDTISNLPQNAQEIVVRRGAWRLGSPGLTPLQVIVPLRKQLVDKGLDFRRRKAPAGQFIGQFAGAVFSKGKQPNGCLHQVVTQSSSPSTRASLTFSSVAPVPGVTSRAWRILPSISAAISLFSKRNLTALALPWPILSPW